MFRDRSRLHKKCYQHKVVKIIDKMMVRIFQKNTFFFVKSALFCQSKVFTMMHFKINPGLYQK